METNGEGNSLPPAAILLSAFNVGALTGMDFIHYVYSGIDNNYRVHMFFEKNFLSERALSTIAKS